MAGKLLAQKQKLLTDNALGPKTEDSAYLHHNFSRTDGRARAFMMTKLGTINWPRQMKLLAAGEIPVAILNGADDPFLNHDDIARLSYGQLWGGAPQDIKHGLHVPFLAQPEAFNRRLRDFLHQS